MMMKTMMVDPFGGRGLEPTTTATLNWPSKLKLTNQRPPFFDLLFTFVQRQDGSKRVFVLPAFNCIPFGILCCVFVGSFSGGGGTNNKELVHLRDKGGRRTSWLTSKKEKKKKKKKKGDAFGLDTDQTNDPLYSR